MGSSADAPALVLVTDRHATGGRDLVDVVARALDAGLPAVQLRDKDLSGRALLVLAERLRALTARTRRPPPGQRSRRRRARRRRRRRAPGRRLDAGRGRAPHAAAARADRRLDACAGRGRGDGRRLRRLRSGVRHAVEGGVRGAAGRGARCARRLPPRACRCSRSAASPPTACRTIRGAGAAGVGGDPGHPGGRRCGAGDARPAPDARLTPRSRGLPLLAIPGRMRRGEGGYELHLLPHRGRRDSRRGRRADDDGVAFLDLAAAGRRSRRWWCRARTSPPSRSSMRDAADHLFRLVRRLADPVRRARRRGRQHHRHQQRRGHAARRSRTCTCTSCRAGRTTAPASVHTIFPRRTSRTLADVGAAIREAAARVTRDELG